MKQESGDNSTNIQVKGDYNNGLSYSDARQVALDVFKANYYELSKEAMETVNSRLALITDNIIKKIYTELTDKVERLKEPSIQSSIYEVQKEYVKTGDDILGSQLTNILIERIKSTDRTLKQIALDEAIRILPKLTNEQIDMLTFSLSLVYLHRVSSIANIAVLKSLISSEITPFCHANVNKTDITHLQSCGCLTLMPETKKFIEYEDLLGKLYPGLFNNGFTEQEAKDNISNDLSEIKKILLTCQHDPLKYQFDGMNEDVLKLLFEQHNINITLRDKIIAFNTSKKMSNGEIKQFVINDIPNGNDIFTLWDNSNIRTNSLTPTGKVIALINFNIRANKAYSIDNWLTVGE